MNSLELAPLIAELELAVKNGKSARRIEILRQVTDLFLSDIDRFSDEQIDIFDGVFVRLIECMEARILAQLSLTLSEVDRAPFEAVRMLAYREEPSIAVPVLSKSMRLSDEDLVKIASCRGQEHLLAISSRNVLTEVVTDALIKRGNSEVAQKLAENAGASFSKYGYMALVADAEKDEGLAEKLGLRLDIPINILKQLLRRATEAVRRRLLLLANPEIRDRIQAAIDDIAEEFDNSVPTAADYAESESTVLEINRNGHLNEAAVNMFALHKEHANIIVALSLLTAVATDAIEPLYYSPRSDGLIVACRAAKLGWITTSTVLRSRGGSSIDANGGPEENQKIFEALSISSALRTLRFWAARSAAKKAETPQLPIVA